MRVILSNRSSGSDSTAVLRQLHQSLRFVLRDQRAHYLLGFGPQAAAPHHRRYAGVESPRVEWLVEHVIDALRQQIARLTLGTLRRYHDDRHVYQSDHGARGVDDLSTIENRELQPDDKGVGRILRQY